MSKTSSYEAFGVHMRLLRPLKVGQLQAIFERPNSPKIYPNDLCDYILGIYIFCR